MLDNKTTIEELKNKIKVFSQERNWLNNENGKDLVMALSVEASELLEIFQWIHSDDADKIKDDENKYIHLKEEIADVFWYLMRVCSHYDIDLTEAVGDKEVKNAKKYPKAKEI